MLDVERWTAQSAHVGVAIAMASALAACADVGDPFESSDLRATAQAVDERSASGAADAMRGHDEAAEAAEAAFLDMDEAERREWARGVLAEAETTAGPGWAPRFVSEPGRVDADEDGPCTTEEADSTRAGDDGGAVSVGERAPYNYARPDATTRLGVPQHVHGGGEVVMPTSDPELGALYQAYRASGCATEEAETSRVCQMHPYRQRTEERRADPTARAIAALEESSERRP